MVYSIRTYILMANVTLLLFLRCSYWIFEMCAIFVFHSYVSLLKLCVLNQTATVQLVVLTCGSLMMISAYLSSLRQLKKKSEDTKGVIRSHKSKARQYNNQQKKDKRTNNELQSTTQKTYKDLPS